MTEVHGVEMVSFREDPHHSLILVDFHDVCVLFAGSRQLSTAVDPAHDHPLKMVRLYFDRKHFDCGKKLFHLVVFAPSEGTFRNVWLWTRLIPSWLIG